MKRRRCTVWMVGVLLLAALWPMAVFADMGPKPSVTIAVAGGEGQAYYGTLLSQTASTGPASAWDGRSDYSQCWQYGQWGEEGRPVWEAFVRYQDPDGFYFLQEWWDCTQTQSFAWTYYPPSTFKVLLYFPQEERFLVSPVCQTYAFDSHFTVQLPEGEGELLTVTASYQYGWEAVSLVVRYLLTFLVEMGVALLFGYRGRKALVVLAVVNGATQLGLNLALGWVNYAAGSMAFVGAYILLELAVFGVEAAVYARTLPRRGFGGKGRAVCYSLVANGVSFALGLWLARVIPGIF